MNERVLMFGGGLDSTAHLVLLNKAGVKFDLLWVNYGQVSAVGEERALGWWADYGSYISTVYIDTTIRRANAGQCSCLFTGDLADPPFVVGRNFLLASIAAPQWDEVYFGISGADQHFPDCTIEWFDAVSRALSLSFDRPKRVTSKFIDIPRAEVIKAAWRIEPQLFDRSWTCWVGRNGVECGECPHCLNKRQLRKQCES